ncbi:MMPL family transporter [Pseudarthrobacter sp. NKDBFgelt]|uniref:MMPL family transporter n=1 Tax=Pseudarthrobacter sp. NKDBFgelt TaxID=3384443 RepID=UPI0038D35C50
MASLLYHLGRLAYRRRWWVLAVWTAVVLGTGGAAVAFQGTMSNNFSIPGTESQRVLDQLEEELPEAAGGSGAVVFHAGSGSFTPAQEQAIGDALDRLKDIPEVQSAASPFELQDQIDAGAAQLAEGKAQLDAAKKQITEGLQQLDAQQAQLDAAAAAGVPGMDQALAQLKTAREQLDAGAKEIAANEEALALGQRKLDASAGMRTVSADRTSAVTQIQFTQSIYEVAPEVREEVKETILAASASGVEVYLSQSITQDVSEVLGTAEIIGVGVAALVLIVMLGTLVAAGLPLLMAIIGVAVGVGATFALSGVIEMASVSVFLALMLGLAVGIDYSLFIVNRHRSQLLHGMAMEESVARATGTSGNSVLFAGLTVVIALAALAVPGLPFLTIMGLAGAGTVALAVLVALTLTPAMLGFIGTRVLSKRAWDKARTANAAAAEKAARAGTSPEALEEAEDQEHSRHGWGAFVTRHPIIVLTVTVLALAITALPAAQLRVALPDGGTEPVNSDAYKAYSTLGESFGEGVNGPIIAVGKLPAGLSAAESEKLQYDVADRLRDVKNVTAALPALLSEDGRTAIFQVIPAEGPASASTEQVVADLRSAASDIETDTRVSIGLTGQTAANIDVSEKLFNALPLYLGVVIGLSLVLLLLVFRSILVPLLATGGFLLSMAATFGAIVAVYQWGWLGEIFGVHNPAAVLSFLPIILIGVLFGLAMDYQVFLVSGMRESHIHGEDARSAVRTGFSHGARVVTAAAIIMTAVFAGFIFSGLTMVRPIGFSLSFGVLVDAFLIRMTIIPAAMHLLAEKAWWIPRWLDRILPDVDVEGAKLPAAPAPAGPSAPELVSTRD